MDASNAVLLTPISVLTVEKEDILSQQTHHLHASSVQPAVKLALMHQPAKVVKLVTHLSHQVARLFHQIVSV